MIAKKPNTSIKDFPNLHLWKLGMNTKYRQIATTFLDPMVWNVSFLMTKNLFRKSVHQKPQFCKNYWKSLQEFLTNAEKILKEYRENSLNSLIRKDNKSEDKNQSRSFLIFHVTEIHLASLGSRWLLLCSIAVSFRFGTVPPLLFSRSEYHKDGVIHE